MVAAMPAHTRRAHAKGAEWHGDTLAVLKAEAHDGFEDTDQNAQWVYEHPEDYKNDPSGECKIMHWADPRRNNFHFIVSKDGHTVRRMTKKELRRKVGGGKGKWSLEEVNRWRRGPKLDSTKPHDLITHYRHAKRAGITIIPELKSPAFARPEVAAHCVAAAEKAGVPKWYMALWNLWGIKGKVQAFVGAGAEIAVIFGKRKYLRRVARAAIKTWAVKPTRIW